MYELKRTKNKPSSLAKLLLLVLAVWVTTPLGYLVRCWANPARRHPQETGGGDVYYRQSIGFLVAQRGPCYEQFNPSAMSANGNHGIYYPRSYLLPVMHDDTRQPAITLLPPHDSSPHLSSLTVPGTPKWRRFWPSLVVFYTHDMRRPALVLTFHLHTLNSPTTFAHAYSEPLFPVT